VKRKLVWLITGIVLTVCSCSKDKAKKSANPPQRQVQETAEQHTSEDSVIKGATPEDPGPIATVVSPLTELQRQVNESKAAAETPGQLAALPVDHGSHGKASARHFLHTVFSVSGPTQVAFVVPPHQNSARVKGSFLAFAKSESASEATDVDLMLLNAQQYDNFRHGRPWDVTLQVDPAHDQVVNWLLAPTFDQSEEYHMVFSNTDGNPKTKFVKADFTISFD
jgi:hypothetical protein